LVFQQNEVLTGLGIELDLPDEALLQRRIQRVVAGIVILRIGRGAVVGAVVVNAVDDRR
jgi:hypothetical protein